MCGLLSLLLACSLEHSTRSVCESDLGDLSAQISAGHFDGFRHWLQEHIHQQGQCYSAGELVTLVTGEPLTHRYLVNYLRNKVSEIYAL